MTQGFNSKGSKSELTVIDKLCRSKYRVLINLECMKEANYGKNQLNEY